MKSKGIEDIGLIERTGSKEKGLLKKRGVEMDREIGKNNRMRKREKEGEKEGENEGM